MPEIGPMELLVVAVVALIVFGPEKLPEYARKAGSFFSDMRRVASDMRSELHDVSSGFDINNDDDDDSFDPQDEKSTPASEADEADAKEGPAQTETDDETGETVEGPIVHKETRRPEPQDN